MSIQHCGSRPASLTPPPGSYGSSRERPWVAVREGERLNYNLREHLNRKIIEIKPGESRTIVLPRSEALGDIDARGAAGLQMTVDEQSYRIAVTFRLRESVAPGTEFPITATESHGWVLAPRDGFDGYSGPPAPGQEVELRKVRFKIRAI